MLKRIVDMPSGTLGFEAHGEVEDDDWDEIVEPALKQVLAGGEKLRVLYLLGPTTGDVEGDAIGAGAGFGARHATSFERVAVVSDEDWLRPAMKGLSFLMPGKAKGFKVADLAAAKEWLAAPDPA